MRLGVGAAEFPTFMASHQRLVDFTADKPVAHVLGTHIEQTSTPFVDYPRGTTYQPDEHVLELTHGGVRRRTLLGRRAPINTPLFPDLDTTLAEMLQ